MAKKIKLVRLGSTIARKKDQEATLIGLGLTKRHSVKELNDTPEIRGMIKKVAHLIQVIETK
jgi:large subunit ribosomal protein L30